MGLAVEDESGEARPTGSAVRLVLHRPGSALTVRDVRFPRDDVGCRGYARSMTNVFLIRIESPIGRIEVVADDEPSRPSPSSATALLPHDGEPERTNAVLDARRAATPRVLRRHRTEFDVPVRLHGTPSSRPCGVELQRLDWGEATSYGALAAAVGKPGSARAIGGAVGANPVPIIVGCHRVLASDGRITGYSARRGRSDQALAARPRAASASPRERRFRGPRSSSATTARPVRVGRRSDPEYRRYHDEEWGTPQHDPVRLFEKVCLEGFQAGLSWITILRRRPAFREVFHGFDVERVAAMTEADVERLLGDERIIRHRGKIEATIQNAAPTLELDVPIDELIWGFAPAPRGSAPPRSPRFPPSRPSRRR